MELMELVEVNVALGVALLALSGLRKSTPALVAGLFFLTNAALNASVTIHETKVSDLVFMYMAAAMCNVFMIVVAIARGDRSSVCMLMIIALAACCFQNTVMFLDEYANEGVETFVWSISYEFRVSMDFIMVALAIASLSNKGH